MFLRASADYRAPDGRVLALRWITLGTSSGRESGFPLERISGALLGPGVRGGCLHDTTDLGQTGPLRSPEQLQHALASGNPRGLDRFIWLLGLRPYRSNHCLWVGMPGALGRAFP
jgi:hypothetical protein